MVQRSTELGARYQVVVETRHTLFALGAMVLGSFSFVKGAILGASADMETLSVTQPPDSRARPSPLQFGNVG